MACSRPWSTFSFTDTKQSLQYTIKTHLHVSGSPLPKYELYTCKPSQLHETAQQNWYCEILYLTTFDNFDPEATLSGATPYWGGKEQ